MKFSIVVPIYKTEKYVKQCVDSILSQSYTDFELILVDDGSPDNSGKICDDYAQKDCRVRVIHKQNGGAADSRNVGMKSAKGEYLCFLDADDFWLSKNVLQTMSDHVDKTQCDVLTFGYRFYYDLKNEYSPDVQNDVSQYDKLSNEDALDLLVKESRLNPAAWGMCIKNGFIKTNDLYFVPGIKSEDVEWAIRIYNKVPRIAVLDDKFYAYRKEREGSVTAMINYGHLKNYCDIIDGGIELVKNSPEKIKTALMNYIVYQTVIATALLHRKSTKLNRSQKKELHKRIKSVFKNYIKTYHENKKVDLAKKVYSLCGYAITSFVLGFYLNHRGR